MTSALVSCSSCWTDGSVGKDAPRGGGWNSGRSGDSMSDLALFRDESIGPRGDPMLALTAWLNQYFHS